MITAPRGRVVGAAVWALVAFSALGAPAAIAAAEPTVIPLWPKGAPGALGSDASDIPSITAYLPDPAKATGAAFVVCPGGGYGMLAVEHEGKQVAEWLNSLGIASFVLKYRLGPRYHHPAPLQDAQRAIRTVRARAGEWKLDPKRIGILGFSAGGHLASTAGTHFDAGKPDAEDPIDRQSSRPDLLILGYPVVAMATEYGHSGSKKNLLGENPPAELVESLSNERQVTKDTPPTFIAHTNEDTAVPAENALLFVMALRKHKVPVELHLFEKGRHGLGLGGGTAQFNIPPDEAFQEWPKLAAIWLARHGFVGNQASQAADVQALQGRWRVVQWVQDGQEVGADQLEDVEVRIEGNRFTVMNRAGEERRGEFELDPNQSPKAITRKLEGAEVMAPGIYRIEGDTFTTCFPLPGTGEKPRGFEAPVGSKLGLMVFRRLGR